MERNYRVKIMVEVHWLAFVVQVHWKIVYIIAVDGMLFYVLNKIILINWNRCTWQKAAGGEWVYCPTGYIATGHCGSAGSPSCGVEYPRVNHEL
eukprot:913863_1